MKHASLARPLLVLALASTGLVTSSLAFASPTQDNHSTAQKVGNQLSNSAITAKVKAALVADSRTKAFDTNVETDGDAMVSLHGTAPTQEAKQAAAEVARNVDGVKSVRNSLVVTGDRTANPKTISAKGEATGENGWLTTKVKGALVDDDRVSAMDVKVESNQGAVTLSGTVPNEAARQAAVERARGVKGVTSVDASGLSVGTDRGGDTDRQ